MQRSEELAKCDGQRVAAEALLSELREQMKQTKVRVDAVHRRGHSGGHRDHLWVLLCWQDGFEKSLTAARDEVTSCQARATSLSEEVSALKAKEAEWAVKEK